MDWLTFFILAFAAACLELAFQEYQQKNMIFDWYRNMLIGFAAGKSTFRKKIALVFGLCPYCNGFWVSVAVFFLLTDFHWHYLLLFTGVNAMFIRIIILIYEGRK